MYLQNRQLDKELQTALSQPQLRNVYSTVLKFQFSLQSVKIDLTAVTLLENWCKDC